MRDYWRALSRAPFSVRPHKDNMNALYRQMKANRFMAPDMDPASKQNVEANKRTRIPEDERVRVPFFCITELYTPTTAEGLLEGVPRLVENSYRMSPSAKQNVVRWVHACRRQESTMWGQPSQIQLPPVVRVNPAIEQPNSPMTAPIWMGNAYIHDDMPDGIEQIEIKMHALTATITAVTAAFYLNEEGSRGLEEIVNGDMTTVLTPIPLEGGSFFATITDVSTLKKQAADDWRARMSADGAQWLAKWLPGSFHRETHSQLPTIELLLTEQQRPWAKPGKDRDKDRDWQFILNLSEYEVYWQSNSNCLRLEEHPYDNGRNVITIGALRSEFFSPTPVGFGHGQGFAYFVWPLASRWALTAFLRDQREQLANIRDLTDRASRRRSPRALTDVEREMMLLGLDCDIVTADIVDYAKAEKSWEYNFPDFALAKRDSNTDVVVFNTSLAEHLRQGQLDLSDKVRREETVMRDLLNAGAQLLASAENLRLQFRVLFLTIVSLIVAVVAALAAVAALHIRF